jgi:hypothetical protein
MLPSWEEEERLGRWLKHHRRRMNARRSSVDPYAEQRFRDLKFICIGFGLALIIVLVARLLYRIS